MIIIEQTVVAEFPPFSIDDFTFHVSYKGEEKEDEKPKKGTSLLFGGNYVWKYEEEEEEVLAAAVGEWLKEQMKNGLIQGEVESSEGAGLIFFSNFFSFKSFFFKIFPSPLFSFPFPLTFSFSSDFFQFRKN